MRKTIRVSALFLALIVLWGGVITAQETTDEGPLVVAAENRTAAEEAERGAPRPDEAVRVGDLIRYTLTFKNPSDGPVSSVVLHNSFPAGMSFVEGSAVASRSDMRVEYSADGGESFSVQPVIEVVEGGERTVRPATPDEYTDVRWVVEGSIQPGAEVSASYELQVSAGLPGTEQQGS